LVGGIDKGNDLIEIAKSPSFKNVKKIYLYGNCAEKFYKPFKNIINATYINKTLKESVYIASEDLKNSSKGSTILLSPACSSFDQFNNFEDRGNKFKEIVKSYIENK
jgi:UDP-N-acetylmuramoylalanine--D-glutamate ligase